jgi:hypothetical protein
MTTELLGLELELARMHHQERLREADVFRLASAERTPTRLATLITRGRPHVIAAARFRFGRQARSTHRAEEGTSAQADAGAAA